MNPIVELFKNVRLIPGAAAKAAFLKEHRSPLLDQIIADAMDPSVTYGITSKELELGPCPIKADLAKEYGAFHEMLGRLARRELTGGTALGVIASEIMEYDEDERALLKQILDRDLKLGVSWKTYREDVMGLTDKFEVALAQHLEKAKGVDPTDGAWYASRKLDGVRCVAILVENEAVFKSRQNKEFKTLENLKPAVKRFCANLEAATGIKGWVLDGELCKVDENGDEDFKAIVSEVKRKDYSIEDCCYRVFDVLPYADFCAGYCEKLFHDRLATLTLLNNLYTAQKHERCWVKPLEQELIHSQDDLDRWAGYVEKGNWEGFMLRKDVPYRSGRTKDLLKVKLFNDFETTVNSVETGKMTTALPGEGLVEYEGVTALHITYEGCDVRVGAGLSREQRIAWMKDPSLIIGKTVTIKYFETTTNAQGGVSLRFPTLKYVYENGRDV